MKGKYRESTGECMGKNKGKIYEIWNKKRKFREEKENTT